jgi:hypothetical protein
VCDCVTSVDLTPAIAGSSVSAADPEELTLYNVRDGKVKTNVLKKVQLQELCTTLIGHIDRLELELKKNKAPQVYWDTGDRQVIPWDAIHRLAPEQNGTHKTSNVEDDCTKRVVNTVVNAVSATSVKEDGHNTSSKGKSAKLAKLVKLAKSR